MNVDNVPPMKPVLVTDISDDANVLQKDDVTKQRTVLTARAIEDIFKCAPITKTNDPVELHPDNAYFDEDGKIDLDLIVTAQSRRLEEDSYTHGPADFNLTLKDEVWPGLEDKDYLAAAHSSKVVAVSGFLYVYSVLDDSSLAWDNYNGKIPVADTLGASGNHPETVSDVRQRRVHKRAYSPEIRQIFVSTEFDDLISSEGTKGVDDPAQGDYLLTHRTRYNQGLKFTRVGKLIDEENGVYEWEDWHELAKTHNGPEYFTNIRLLDNSGTGVYERNGHFGSMSIEAPLTDAVYHVYTQVSEFVLPNANLDAFKVGQKIIIEVHPPLNEGDLAPSCLIKYSDTLALEQEGGIQDQQLLVTPTVKRNTKDVYGRVTSSLLTTTVAAFEIVEINDGNGNTFRTWELDVGSDESNYIAGLAQMLGEHTDTVVPDIVHAQDISRSNLRTIDVIYPCTSCGYVMANFLKTVNTPNDTTWSAVVQIINPLSDAAFVRATESEPDPSSIYYIRDNEWWIIAENHGHPDSFAAGSEYYVLTESECDVKSVIRITDGSSVRETLALSDLTVDKARRFAAYANRGCIIQVKIESTSRNMSAFQGNLFPVVGFYPDQHDSYISRVCINPEAFTVHQLEQLYLDGSVVDDIKLFVSGKINEGIMNAPVATRALIEAYAYLASKLQSKGLLLGNCLRANVTSGEMNEIVSPGSYYITASSVIQLVNNFPPDAITDTGSAVVCSPFNLVVIGNGHANSGAIHEEEGTIVAADKVMQIALLMNDTNNPMRIMTRVGTKDGSTWTWTPWRGLNDWNYIVNKPLYYRSRWDYFSSPNNIISLVDNTTTTSGMVVMSKNLNKDAWGSATVSGSRCIKCEVSKYYITNLMEVSDDPAYDENVNYEVPQIMIGIKSLAKTTYSDGTSDKMHYLFNITLPTAVNVSTLSDEKKKRRRKIRFLFYGDPTLNGWDSVNLRVVYAGVSGNTYQYKRNWGCSKSAITGNTSNVPSIMSIEFEQMDLPTGERIWSPIEVG